MPPPPEPPLSPAVLAALGLVVQASCTGEKPPGDTGSVTACLDYITTGVCLNTSPCLEYVYPTATTGDTGSTSDTGATSDTSDTSDTGAASLGASRSARFERLAAEGVLPPDIVERLRRR